MAHHSRPTPLLPPHLTVPTEISAHVGDNVTLHCYGSTNKQATDGEIYVQWEKDGQTVLKIDPTNTTFGPGFIDRTSVTRDGYGEGDLSLTFTGVRSSDQGTYLCFFNQDSKPGYPHGVTLTVNGGMSIELFSHLSIVFNIHFLTYRHCSLSYYYHNSRCSVSVIFKENSI
jgi:hypothetical protein